MARETIERKVTFNKDDVLWFEEHFPRASISGISSMLMAKFREAYGHTPKDYAAIAAQNLSDELNGKEKDNGNT